MSSAVRQQPSIHLRDDRGIRPPLKWAGGKRWLAPRIRKLFERHQHLRLVEPFCGGLAVTLGVLPEEALLNDINPHAVSFYRWLKRGLVIDLTMDNDETAYYRMRQRFNDLIAEGRADSREAAALFYYLNRTGYNGLCRFNRKGSFNVPFGRYKKINYRRDFRPYMETLARWRFSSGDFELLDLSSRDFIYADPPYDVEFRQYSKEGFSWQDQVRLAHWLRSHRGPAVISNQATERIVELYEHLGFVVERLDAPRMISCTGDRTRSQEVLAYRNL